MTAGLGAALAGVALLSPLVALLVGPAGFVAVLLALVTVGVLWTEHHHGQHDDHSATSGPLRPVPTTGAPGSSTAPSWAPGWAPDDTGAPEDGAEVVALSDEQLCWRWRASYSRLVRATGVGGYGVNAAVVARTVALRQVYLDELQRRDQHGFAAWMNSGARAGSDPGRYIKVNRRP